MSQQLRLAAVQMDVQPAPVFERLARAEVLVRRAAEAGARLILLPELFNTGYQYATMNYYLAETLNGPTATWLQQQATAHNCHLAGSFLRREDEHIYNTLLLAAPDGRYWLYDKQYPWGWERAYFQAGYRVDIAETSLGRIGMLICWDTAHPQLWRRYAAQVDLMLVSSSPPQVTNPRYHLPDNHEIGPESLGMLKAGLGDDAPRLFSEGVPAQAAWLGVPLVAASAGGTCLTPLPAARNTLLSLLPMAPHLARYLSQADQITLEAPLVGRTQIRAADGTCLAELPQGAVENVIVQDVTVHAERRQPEGSQPVLNLHPLSYLLSDRLLPFLTHRTYNEGRRRAIGQKPPRPWGRYLSAFLLLAGLIWWHQRRA